MNVSNPILLHKGSLITWKPNTNLPSPPKQLRGGLGSL